MDSVRPFSFYASLHFPIEDGIFPLPRPESNHADFRPHRCVFGLRAALLRRAEAQDGLRGRGARGRREGGNRRPPFFCCLTHPLSHTHPTDRTLTLDLPVDATVETVLAAVEARQGEFFWRGERRRERQKRRSAAAAGQEKSAPCGGASPSCAGAHCPCFRPASLRRWLARPCVRTRLDLEGLGAPGRRTPSHTAPLSSISRALRPGWHARTRGPAFRPGAPAVDALLAPRGGLGGSGRLVGGREATSPRTALDPIDLARSRRHPPS